jgi:hypothetical protein
MALLDPRVAGSALTGIVEQAWVVVATPQWAIVSTLLVDEPMEQMLNLALQHLARGRKGDANALLQALLDSRELLRSCNVRIDGWPIGQAVDALALAADEGANDEARLARLRGCASRIIAAIKRGTTPVGDLWYLFQVHKWRLMDAARNGDERRMLDAMEAMRSIASSSIYLPACAAAEGLLGAQSVTQVRAVFTRLLAAPHPMPNYRNWLIYGRWLRECITNSACEVDGTAEETITGILLDGLEHSYGCETQSLLPGSSMRRPELCADPLFNELAAQLARGNITAAQIKRLQQFIERYGVCIPAVPDQVPLIRDIMLWRQRVTGYRVGPSVTVTQH